MTIRSQILETLGNASFQSLFLSEDSPRWVDQPGTKESLTSIALSSEVASKIRVLAHELSLEAGGQPDASLAEKYCKTLPETFPHNAWGMPGHYAERLGKTLVGFGRPALPCLIELLGDRRPLGYFGSEEPTLSERMQYRVCDLAAYFASLIAGLPYRDDPDTKARDDYIRQLMLELQE